MRVNLPDYFRRHGGGRLPDDRVSARLAVFCRFADDLSRLSTCRRLSVGAVVVPPDLSGVVSVGYNGPPAGLPNDGCRDHVPGGCGCVHGEANALVKVRRGGGGLVLLLTDSPCEHCAGLVLNSAGVAAVVYGRAYRDPRGVDVLLAGGVVPVHAPYLFDRTDRK